MRIELQTPETFEEVANINALAPFMKQRYIDYMTIRWKDKEEMQCLSGYAQEWCDRFICGAEYGESDDVGQMMLVK